MAVAQYYVWDRQGRPLNPARPVHEIVDRMKLAYPRAAAAHLFSWYADDAHYQADRPQDHTPYSVTGWPVPNPYPTVCATDIMHRPDLGVDCYALFAYWIAEARVGRMPWLKYLIWQGKSYDVRSGWVAKAATGHFDHIHISTRTDHINTSLGSWSLTGDDDVSFADETIPATAGNGLDHDRTAAVCTSDMWNGETGPDSGFAPGVMTYRQAQLKRIEDDLAELKARPLVEVDAAALAAALIADPAFAEMVYQQSLKAAQQAEKE